MTQNSHNASQTGFQVLDATAGTYAGRTLVAGTGISITNTTGTGGNPTISATGSSGGIIQQVRISDTSSVTGNSQITNSTTLPTTSNTSLLISLAITPVSASNILYFDFNTFWNYTSPSGTPSNIYFYLFNGSTFIQGLGEGVPSALSFDSLPTFYGRYFLAAGTTSSTTFNIRWSTPGSPNPVQTLQNPAGTPFCGAAGNTSTQFTITEVAP